MSDELNVDQIVAETEVSTNNEIPMEAQPQEAPQEQAPTPQEYEFDYQGKKIKAPVEKILKWASMGYDAPNRIGELSHKLKDYENRFKTYETYEKTYKPIDEWARQNPDKWQALFDQWQQAQFGVQPQPNGQQPQYNIPPELIQKIQAFDQRFQQQDQERELQRRQESDQKLDQEILELKKKHPDFDFEAEDNGSTREHRVLEHATKFNIPSFEAAFWHLYGPKLNELSRSKGMETASKALSPKTRSGLLGKDSAPTKGQVNVSDLIKNRNYDQIHELVLAEHGLG